MLIGCFRIREIGVFMNDRQSGIERERLEAGIDDCTTVANAHHAGQHEQALLERDVVGSECVAPVIGIHERIGARLQFVPDARGRFVMPRTGPATRYDRDRDIGRLDEIARLARQRRGASDRVSTLVR